jgi:hypothetical protein
LSADAGDAVGAASGAGEELAALSHSDETIDQDPRLRGNAPGGAELESTLLTTPADAKPITNILAGWRQGHADGGPCPAALPDFPHRTIIHRHHQVQRIFGKQ